MSHLRGFANVLGSVLIFWVWNLWFLLTALFTVLQIGSLDLEADFWLGLLSLVVVPLLSVGVGVWRIREPRLHLRWFYAVEAPLMLVAVFRIFLVRELTLTLAVVMGLLILSVLAHGAALLGVFERRPGWGIPAGSLVLLGGAWVGGLLSLWLLPHLPDMMTALIELIGDIIREFFRFHWVKAFLREPWILPLVFGWLGVVLWTMTLLLGLVPAFLTFSFQQGAALLREGQQRLGATPVVGGALITVGLVGVLVAALPEQPQVAAFERLAPEQFDEATRRALRADEAALRDGLVNAALSSYRYWGSVTKSSTIAESWEPYLGDAGAHAPQDLFNLLIFPLLYAGSDMRSDQARAETLYANFFDVPLQKAEKDALRHAINATWERETAEAGVMDIDAQRVLLERQDLTMRQEGDIATFQLDEVYANQTDDIQEIALSFSLPQSAALTGLWLSDEEENPTLFPYVVAPRGAAQQVYNEQKTARRDPALLEQVGPRQYRLRVFPIPEQFTHKKMYLRMTWTVLGDDEGFALPRLSERRNLYWDRHTARSLDGAPHAVAEWLPAYIHRSLTPQTHRVTLPDGRAVQVEPASGAAPTVTGARIAVLLDSSRSMEQVRAEVEAEWAWMGRELAPRNDVSWFVTAGWGAGEAHMVSADWSPAEQVYFGGLDPAQALWQMESLATGLPFDYVLFLTDQGSYELASDDPLPEGGGALWMIHLGGALPHAYPDALLDRLQASGGGVAISAAEAMARIGSAHRRIDGRTWSFVDAGQDDPLLLPLAARWALDADARAHGMDSLEELDAGHRLATAAHIVSPWSSLLVLVDDAQRRRLAELEAKADRFDREVEGGIEQVSSPLAALEVSSVPEPETWALLLLGLAWVGWSLHKQRGRSELSRIL